MEEHLARLGRVAEATPPAPASMAPYLAKVRDRAYAVTDADVDALLAAGHSEDELFDQSVAVAIAEGLRRLEAAGRAIG